jgi:hypothetical protein
VIQRGRKDSSVSPPSSSLNQFSTRSNSHVVDRRARSSNPGTAAGRHQQFASPFVDIPFRTVAVETTAIPLTHRDTPQSVRIGRRFDCCSFEGTIDDVRLYKRALTEAEVKAIASSR